MGRKEGRKKNTIYLGSEKEDRWVDRKSQNWAEQEPKETKIA